MDAVDVVDAVDAVGGNNFTKDFCMTKMHEIIHRILFIKNHFDNEGIIDEIQTYDEQYNGKFIPELMWTLLHFVYGNSDPWDYKLHRDICNYFKTENIKALEKWGIDMYTNGACTNKEIPSGQGIGIALYCWFSSLDQHSAPKEKIIELISKRKLSHEVIKNKFIISSYDLITPDPIQYSALIPGARHPKLIKELSRRLIKKLLTSAVAQRIKIKTTHDLSLAIAGIREFSELDLDEIANTNYLYNLLPEVFEIISEIKYRHSARNYYSHIQLAERFPNLALTAISPINDNLPDDSPIIMLLAGVFFSKKNRGVELEILKKTLGLDLTKHKNIFHLPQKSQKKIFNKFILYFNFKDLPPMKRMLKFTVACPWKGNSNQILRYLVMNCKLISPNIIKDALSYEEVLDLLKKKA